MAYSTHTWTTSEPITQEKMNNIHEGIDSALSNAANAATAASDAASAASAAASAASDAMAKAIQVENTATQNQQKINHGELAWNQLVETGVTVDGSGNVTSSLDNRLDNMDQSISNLGDKSRTIEDWISTAISMNSPLDYNENQILSLADRIGKMNYDINVALTNSSSALSYFSQSNATNILVRLDRLDGSPSSVAALPQHRVQELITEIYGALESSKMKENSINKSFTHLDDRFEYDEEKILDNTTAIANNATAIASRIRYNEVVTDLDTNSSMPLAASKGYELYNIIGRSFSSANGHTVKDGIDNALQTAKSYTNGLLGQGVFDTTNTVAARIDAIDNASTGTVAGLDSRLSAVETEIGTLSTSRIDALENALTGNGGINDRLDAIDNSTNGRMKVAEDDIDALEITIGDSNNGLVKAVADNTSAISNINTAITSLQGKDTVVIGKASITYGNDGKPTNIGQTPTANADYLLQKDDKYYYWRYINDTWQLISGAGGSGSSSGMFAASLSATDIPTPNINTDYFVGDNTVGYTHYRYVINNNVGSFVKILPKGLLANASVNSNGKPIITTLEDSNTNVLSNFNALKTVNCTTTYDTDGSTPKSYSLTFTDINGQEYAWDLAAGGGGSAYNVQFINESTDLTLYVPNNATSANIAARIQARLGTELLSQAGTITVKYKAETASDYTTDRVISNITNNTITTINVIDLLAENSVTNIWLTASIQPEDTPIVRNLIYTIHRVPMSIEAYNYNPASVKTSNFDFLYYCIGNNLDKTVHFVIDGTETTEYIGKVASTDLQTKRISVESLARGMHSLTVYFTVGAFSSNKVNTYFLYDDNTNVETPIIALATNKTTIQSGEDLNLYYTVYTKGLQKTAKVTLETYTIANDVRTLYETKEYTDVDNSIEQTVAITNYPTSGKFYITMEATNTVNNVEYTNSKTIDITITEYQSAYDAQMVRAGTSNLIYEYSAAGRTNNDNDKAAYKYTFTSVSGATEIFTGASTGFNWASNGYTNGQSLIISGGAVHTVNVPLFTAATNNVSLETDSNNDDILKNGRTFEIDYEVDTATDLSAEIASFGNGLKITPSVSYLVPQGTTVTVNSHGLIEKEDEICAAYLATGKRMHMVFVIEPKSTTPTSQGEYHQCVNIYINGEFVNSCPYALSENFSTNSTFTIGSNTCIIKLYSIRMYNRGLNNDEVLRNYMMAPSTKNAKIDRFAANDVLDNNKLVSYEKARNKFNCLLITGEISPYKKTTKTPSGVTLTKPDLENLTYTTEFNLLDKKANGTYYSSNNVQGTSSQTYPIHNLKVYLAEEDTDSITGEKISKKVKYSLKGANGIAESTLCWKADYMSTDHANTYNANFANDLFTDKLPSQVADSKVQNTIYGIRCLLFQRDDENSIPVFIADGCLNNDKGNNNAFGLSIKNESLSDTTRQKWEFTNNSSALDFFRADGLLAQSNGDFYAKTAFESTFPDEGDLEDEGLQPNYNHLQVLMTWVHQRANFWDASTTAGTGGTYNETSYSTERELKKAIFINEFQQHFNLNHILTYHLFSEFIALCDNRAKNMFLRCDNVRIEQVFDTSNNEIFNGNSNPNASFFESTTNIGTNDDPIYAFTHANQINWENSTFAIWYPVLYDLDSCYGVENVGRITIPYDAEWDYSYNNKRQFSGVESRLWLMVEEAFSAELKSLAQILYPNSLNYNTFYNDQIVAMNESICPAVTNQDMLLKFNAYWADGFIDYSLPNNPHVYRDYKYIQRGSRAYQKDTFIKLRSNYLSSKYVTSNFMNDQIRFRSSVVVPVSNSGITLTTNQTLYPAITYGDNKEAIRSATKIGPGGSVTLYASDQVGNTDTIHIGGASALTDIGDISKFEPYNLDVSGGINLKSLVIGSNVVNASTNKIDGLGSCALLETINVRNCTNFSGTLNLSGNGLIKNIYASGSNISNIELREGGNLTNIEYSAATTTIKIINHSGLQNFVYEDSANNHYANLTKLHVENTPKVPIVDIINNAMSHLTAGIRLTGIDIDLFKDLSTQEEIDAALEKTTLFLNTLVSDLSKGKYINSAGIFIANSTENPYIAGKVHITSIRSSLLTKLNAMYPNLIIYNTINENGVPSNNVTTEYTIEYRNYDGTLLYTDYRIGSEHFIDPVSDTNPITGHNYLWQICPPDGIPTKPKDAQYEYRFGTYDNNGDYEPYSGWVKQYTTTNPTSQDYPQGNTVFIAYYPTKTIRQYTVTWYEEPGGPVKLSYTTDYGVDISTYQQPEERGLVNRVKVDNNITKVFKGWNRPVGKLVENVNVYAVWETSDINNGTDTIDMSTLNAADIQAISQLGEEAKVRLLEDKLGTSPIFITMGQDFNYSAGVTTTDLLNGNSKFIFTSNTTEAKIYDGAHGLGEVRPLAVNEDWTLALDYKFLLNYNVFIKSSEYVLASCYKNANSTIQGFKVSLIKNNDTNTNTRHAVQVTWGTDSATIDYVTIDAQAISNPSSVNAKQYCKSYRNMIVIRHKASDPTKLYLYYNAPDTTNTYSTYGAEYGLEDTVTTLEWANINNFNTPLILGGNYSENTTDIENSLYTRCPAKAIVYWAKYWNVDLGEKNCRMLAQWPHEVVPFYLTGYNNNSSPNRSIISSTNLSFVAAQGVGDRYLFANRELAHTYNGTATTEAGWRVSRARTLCNNRIYKGMPIAYQSIIRNTSIGAASGDMNNANNKIVRESANYCYLPSEREVVDYNDSNNNIVMGLETNEVDPTWPSPWPWMKPSNVSNLYGFTQGSSTLELQTATNITPFLFRFSGYYIKPTARIYNISTDPYNNGNSWTYNNGQIYVQSGDVWINNGIAYMYFTNNDIDENGIYVDIVTNGGGWKKADLWQLRTYNYDSTYSNENQFRRIEDNGTITLSPVSTQKRNEGRLLCPEFSI